MKRNTAILLHRAISVALAHVALPAAALYAQDAAVSTAEVETENGKVSALRAAAEAIDPLGRAAQAEAAWTAYYAGLEASGGSVLDKAFALNRIADTLYYQQKPQDALASSQTAQRLLEDAGESGGEAMADTLANLAVMYGVVGQRERELPLQSRSLEIRQSLYGKDPLPLPPEQAKSLALGYLNYANALYQHGRFSEAADLVKPSIDGLIVGELQDSTLFVAMSTGANMLADAGRPQEALEMAQRGVETATKLLPEGHPFIGVSQGTLAKVLLQSDRFEEAVDPARRSLDILASKLGPGHPYAVTALHNFGVILARLGRFEEALELLTARYDLLDEIDPSDKVISLVTASNVAHELGQDALAMQYALSAADTADNVPPQDMDGHKGPAALALRQDEAGSFDAARTSIDAAIAKRLAAGATDADPTLEIQSGLFAIKAGDQAAGWPRVESGFIQLEQDLLDDADKMELGADLSSYYETLLQVVEAGFEGDRPDIALRAFDLASWGVNARSRQLLSLQTRVGSNSDVGKQIGEFDQLRAQLRLLNRERASLLASDQIDGATKRAVEIALATEKMRALRTSIADKIPGFAEWLRPKMANIGDLQQRLNADQAILITMPSRNRTFTMVIASDSAVLAASNQGRPQVRRLVAQLRSALDDAGGAAEDFPFAAAAELHAIILPPDAAQALAGKGKVAVITSDALSRLPFSVLLPNVPTVDQRDYKAADWLLKHHAFSTALTPGSAFSPHSRAAALPKFLGIGAPNLAGDSARTLDIAKLYRSAEVSVDDIRALPSLPATQNEIREVARAFAGKGQRITLTGDDATEARIRMIGADHFTTALFATHGVVDGQIGGLREPALVLTPPRSAEGSQNDGLLTASEIAELGLRADFVILSACNSAAGRNDTAPAYTGLANAFLGSGSSALMLSHWRVRDDAAAYLTVNTIDAAQRLTRPEALRETQLAILRGDSSLAGGDHPSVWAPFVIIED